jgi:hypothetical protein
MLVTLDAGPMGPGYIYSDKASYHQTFQVIGSRLKPGYAEKGIVSTALDLMKKADMDEAGLMNSAANDPAMAGFDPMK